MVCADNEKLRLGDPRDFFIESLDPPPEDTLEDAIQYLIQTGACRQTEQTPFFQRQSGARFSKKLVPTEYGAMISAMPMSIMDAQVVLEGGRLGMLHETLAMMAVMNHRPAPIVHHFGASELNHVLLEGYYPQVETANNISIALANLSAYLYWDTHWLRAYEKKLCKRFLLTEAPEASQGIGGRNNQTRRRRQNRTDAWEWIEEDDDENIKWCKENSLNPSSMKSIKEIIESSLNALFLGKHEPDWLRCSDPNPVWKRIDNEILESSRSKVYNEQEMLLRLYGDQKMFDLCEALSKLVATRSSKSALPFAQAFFGRTSLKYKTICKRVVTTRQKGMACVHFLMGSCKYGSACKHVHSFSAPRPTCRFYPNCTKGPSCVYSHHESSSPSSINGQEAYDTAATISKAGSQPCFPMLKELSLEAGVLGWFLTHHKNTILLGEGNFEFSKSLFDLGLPPMLATTDVWSGLPSDRFHLIRSSAMIGVDASKLHANDEFIDAIKRMRPTNASKAINFVWNFPFITNEDENPTEHEILVRDTFQSVKLLLDMFLPKHQGLFCLGLHGDQFSRWNVLKSAWAVGWKLHAWDTYVHSNFPGYTPRRLGGEAFPADLTRFYVFRHGDR